MNDDMQSGMGEATRLTGAGRLGEATALIQRLLGRSRSDQASGAAEPPNAQSTDRPPLDLRPDRVQVEPDEGASRGRTTAAHPAPEGQDRPTGAGRALGEILARLKNGELGMGLDRSGQGRIPGLDGLTLPGRPRSPVADEPLPEGARFLAGSFTCAAGSRTYRLYVPSGERDRPRALIVMLHGCTQDASDFAAGTAMNRHAERHGCLVLYPEQAQGANPNRCWNWFDPGHQQADAGEPSIIAGMVRKVILEHGADPDRVFVAGLSAGGAMAAVMAASHPDLFKALGVHSGLAYEVASDMPSAFQAMRDASAVVRPVDAPIPTIVFHGENDRTVHPANAERIVRQWRSAAGAAPHEVVADRDRSAGGRHFSRTRTLGRDGRAAVEQWLIHGSGHAWSGGSEAGSYTDPAGPDASAEMLRFFLEATGRD